MQKNNTLKGLLAVSAVAAMFSAVGVHAQTSLSSNPSQTGTSSTSQPNTSGKTTHEGTIDNTNSTGMENRTKQMHGMGSSGMAGQSASGQASGSSSSAGAAGMTGKSATSSPSMGASGAGQSASGGAAMGAKLSASDEKAVKDMAMADMAEVETGKLALGKSQNSDVKAFAQQMVDDHGQALSKVQALAQARGVTLPTEMDAKHKAMSAKLEKMSGDAFDKSYMANAGVKDHKMVLAKLKSDGKKIKDPDVKALADQHMPVVEQHLKSAQQMHMAKSGTTAGK
jgi:predicted outer membrane protein